MVADQLFATQGGHRRGVDKILVILASGYYNRDQFRDPSPLAKALRDRGVTIYTLVVPGVGDPEQDFEVLRNIAGDVSHMFPFDTYPFLTHTILTSLCPGNSSVVDQEEREHLEAIAQQPMGQDNVTNVLADVNDTLGNMNNTMNSRDIRNTAFILRNAAEIPKLSGEDFDLFLNIIDQTLDSDHSMFALSAVQYNSSNIILDCGKPFNEHLTTSNSAYLNGKNLAHTVTQINCSEEAQTGLADSGNGFEQAFGTKSFGTAVHAAIQIDHGALCQSKAAKAAFTVYRNSKLFSGATPSTDDDNDDDDDNFWQKPMSFLQTKKPMPCTAIKNQPATSAVVSASLVFAANQTNKQTVSASLQFGVPFRKVGLHGQLAAAFWTYKDWDKSGCFVDRYSKDTLKAHCTHLTDFTVLVDMRSRDPALCDTALRIIGYLLSTCSTVVLAFLVILSFLGYLLTRIASQSGRCMGRLFPQSARSGDLIGRCYLCTMLVFFFLFTLFMDRQTLSLSEKGCKAIAGITYCSLLMVICWTLFQGINLLARFFALSKLGRVMSLLTRPYVVLPLCLGLPAVLTLVLWLSVSEFFDRNDDFCWIRPDYVFPAVLLPFCILIVSDLCVTGLLVRRFFFESTPDAHSRRIQSTKASMVELKRKLIVLISMQVVLGFPWIFISFTVGSPDLRVANYLFTILNTSQGILLGMLYVYGVRTRSKTNQPSQDTTTSYTS